MEKKNKIMLISIVILTIAVIAVCVYAVLNRKDEKVNADAIKFRDEYSELNGQTNSNGKDYVNVTISETNTVKYIDEEKAIDLLKDGTGVIYFGFSTCPWCRSLVSILTRVAEEKNETIYYLDILDIRSTFELKDGKLNKVKDGSEGYYEILKLLDKELNDFYLTDEDGNQFDTKEKRLYAPTLVAFKEGKITSVHVGTVESQDSGYDELTDDQVEELESVVEKIIDSKKENDVCTSDKC